MEFYTCPHCGALLRIDGPAAGRVIHCAQCGQPFEPRPGGGASDVIDVQAEVLDGADAPEPREDPVFRAPEYVREGRGGPWPRLFPGREIFTREVERREVVVPGCCCGMGCGLLLAAAVVVLKVFYGLFI